MKAKQLLSIRWEPILRLWLLCIMAAVATACSDKDEAVTPEEEEEVVTSDTMYYNLIRVENFMATTEDDATTVPATLYFSLESKAEVPSTYSRTNRWDMAFGGLYNSFISGNSGTGSGNHGYGGPGVGGILILEQSFDEVTDVPADSEFKTGSDLIGTDDYGDYGEGTGWYLYDFGGTKVRNGEYEDQHVAYALAESLTLKNGTVVKPRTVVVRTAKGNYVKVKMISCYKDLLTQDSWHRTAPHMYFTFEYVMVPAGSTKFEIK